MINTKLILWLLIFTVFSLFLYEVHTILVPFIVSIITAYALNPLTCKLEKIGVRRIYTVTIMVGIFFTIMILAIVKLMPAFFNQVQEFIDDVPKYQQYVVDNLVTKINIFFSNIDLKITNKINEQLVHFSDKFFEYVASVISNIISSSMAILNIVGLVLFTPILVFYLLRDWPIFIKNTHKLIPKGHKKIILSELKEIDKVLSEYVSGQIIVCLLLSLFYSVSLSIVGLKNALLVGIISGILTIIPYVGLIIGGAICAINALIQFSSLEYTYITLGIFLLGHLIESYMITPKLVGDRVGLHPVWIIFAIMAGGALFGFWGMFFAIPLGAIVGVVMRGLIKNYLGSQLYDDHNPKRY